MWCPEGYLTLSEVRSHTLRLARHLVYRSYLGPDAGEDYFADSRRLPDGAGECASSISNWLLQDLLSRDWWLAAKMDGTLTRLDLRPFLSVSPRYPFRESPLISLRNYPVYYNPITSVGPPSPKWMEYYGLDWKLGFRNIDFVRGTIRLNLSLDFWRALALSKTRHFQNPMKAASSNSIWADWARALDISRAFRGQALCVKLENVTQWAEGSLQYLDAFLERNADDFNEAKPMVNDADLEKEGGQGRRQRERKLAATAILNLYGNDLRREGSWKETAKQVSVHLNEQISISTLQRAFNDLREK